MPPALLQNSDTQLLRERAETILWIKTQMAHYRLHLADLQNAGCFFLKERPLSMPQPVRFASGMPMATRGTATVIYRTGYSEL
ncbi:hypothetical protein CTP10_R47040 [Cupriavidus sp. P-10]|uniref:hypothetical protein n=1 Tax=Cupriavidus sp. P-10 TaxID=2027911 RepID=UPI001F2E61E3|nr:hypothetical protein [Cupriavidus sp. P-10]BDB27299.1 hypothetical protein CTP10_R47040 [Cupriavidus sp. P-10]